MAVSFLSGVAFHYYRKSQASSSVVSYQNFTNDDVPALDSGNAQSGGAASAGEFRDDSSDEDNDMITA